MTGLALFLVGVVVGGLVGTGATDLVWRRSTKREHSIIDLDAGTMTEIDQVAITSDFAVHAQRVQAGLREYADRLAGNDEELRGRLRAFEAGVE